ASGPAKRERAASPARTKPPSAPAFRRSPNAAVLPPPSCRRRPDSMRVLGDYASERLAVRVPVAAASVSASSATPLVFPVTAEVAVSACAFTSLSACPALQLPPFAPLGAQLPLLLPRELARDSDPAHDREPGDDDARRVRIPEPRGGGVESAHDA